MKKLVHSHLSAIYGINIMVLKVIFGFTFLFLSWGINAETIPTGSFIINMGVTPQTIGNGLKPYGLIYDLIKNNGVPIKWVINPAKVKDGIDFSHNGIDYRGGTFIIPAAYRTPGVNTKITTYQGMGVIGATSVSAFDIPDNYITNVFFAPTWTLDQQNGGLAVPYFVNAGIPPSAYGGSSSSNWKTPAQLTCCDDIFIMPHADPQWITHGNLYDWNQNCNGAIWLGCHAGSALMDMFKNTAPVDFNLQTNFLVEKTGPANGTGPYFENALLLWGNHSDGTLPYSYDYAADYVMQFMGILDAATQNGSEQIYIPLSPGWRSTTHVGVYDPNHPQQLSTAIQHRPAVVAYGPGMGDVNRGKVMLEASHKLNGSTAPANIAAQRAFFNFGFWAAKDKEFLVSISNLPVTLTSATTYPNITATVTANIPSGPYTYEWISNCGGTFGSPTSSITSYTTPQVSSNTPCIIYCRVTDACGRTSIFGQPVVIEPCVLVATPSLTNPTCNGAANGLISIAVSGGAGPFTWTYTGPSSGSGGPSASPIVINGLTSGTYIINILSPSTGCSKSLSVLLPQPAVLIASTTAMNALCNGGLGSIDLTVTGGTAPYTFSWSDLPGSPDPEDRAGLTAGLYSVTVTDNNGCTTTSSATITQPATALNIGSVVTPLLCNGNTNGAINITVTGGTPVYTYDWVDIPGTSDPEDRSGLPAGIYSVQVTDVNGCTEVQSFTLIQPSLITSSVAVINPTCPPNAQQNNADGAIDLTVSGGSGGYSYSWTASNGGIVPGGQATNQDLTLLVAGTYTVLVTDSNGCTLTTAVTLINNNPNPVQPPSVNN